jgi:aminoglycoside phosphotransferase family enzyme/predicted kinase
MTEEAMSATAEDQIAVIDFLASPSTHGGAAIDRIDTHASIVILAGDRALKLKRAVKYDYLDFSTADLRRRFCEAELRINRRAAPSLYRRVVPVTRDADGSLSLGGAGTPVDWLVEMNRFEQEALFDRRAARGALDLALMAPLADAVAEFHASAEPRRDHGGKGGMKWVVTGNAAGFSQFGARVLDETACARVTETSLGEIERHGALLELRRAGGLVRQCHGDLHLRNIVLLDGRPTLFDAIEFNDEIACTDVLYDLAFLLMDLWKRDLPRHANVVWNRYLSETGDHTGVCLLPLFLSCRSAVRAKTSATAARLQTDSNRKTELENLAREYLAMAEDLLHPPAPRVIAVGGFSGSGKSTLALALAPSIGSVPGAIVFRSDEIRKRLFGVAPLERLEPQAYTAEVSQRVYGALANEAAACIHAGHSAIVDAVYARPSDRQEIEQVALAASVPFVGLWLAAPEGVLIDRTEHRVGDPSDANADIVRLQLAAGAGPMHWHRIDASVSPDVVVERATALLGRHLELANGRVEPHAHA